MKYISATVVCLMCTLAWAERAHAQTVTTGTIGGVVMDSQGAVVPGATVTAVHQPTGTTYETVSGRDGRFTILNVRVGGPYQVTARLAGFRDQQTGDVQVALGEERQVNFTLQPAVVTETVTVTAETTPLDTSRAGTASNVSRDAIESLPSLSRSLFDFARVSPHFTPIALNNDPSSISVAGQNNRYNNVQIDGAVNNDVFGLAPSGTPGGQTESEPISLDAIQELQLVVSPYDVRQGMFAGGGINAITRSGTNQIRGTGYYFGRNQGLVGDSPEGTPIADFSSHEFGASLGGPLVQNRTFYFANVDFGRRDTPSGFSVNSTGQQFGLDAEAARFLDILRNRYSYTPGDTSEFIRDTRNDKVFVRSDFNIRDGHQLVVRHNFINGANDIGRPSTTRYLFPDNFYRFRSKTNSTVAQLNSLVGTAVNELRFTYQRQRDRRGGQEFEERPFPMVDVRVGGGSRFLRAGRENFSSANELDTDLVELTNDFTTVRGRHTITLGTHNEFFKFRNLFIRDAFGNYTFTDLDLFEQGLAQSYDFSFSATGDPRQAARFQVRQFGFYVGDQWRPVQEMTVTLGVRVDLPTFPDEPTRNPDTEAIYGFRTDEVPNQQLWSPRVGLTYALNQERGEQVRAGLGLFSGRTPYVWLSNQYGNTGIEFQRVRATENSRNRIPFVPDANAQARTITGATGAVSRNEIDLIDPDYKYPQLIRGNVAYDREILGGWVGTAELLFSKTVKDIRYQNLNLRQTGSRPDGRPVFGFPASGTPGSQYGDIILLTNTERGHSWTLTFEARRTFRSGWLANASYMYGQSRSIMDGTSSQAASNWGNVYVPGNVNDPPLARSNFDPGHRVNLSLARDFGIGGGARATVSAFYSGQSGRPYSLNFSSDYNGDGRTTNDLLYIPRSADEAVFTGGTFDQFMAFINQEECYSDFIGAIHERNACRAPWINTLDVKVGVNVPTGGRTRTELTFDLSNLTNVFGRESGLLEYANFNDILVARFAGINAATGKPTYDIGSLVRPTFQRFTRDDLKSRWQGKFGVRVRF
ncbi:MAG: TonB-dependent receptor [Acidobacteria bacterium]|nr:TonB-dependent receptor [Acidobacteriota bacterium]